MGIFEEKLSVTKNGKSFIRVKSFMKPDSKIFVAGASGMVGSAIIRALLKNGHKNVIGSYYSCKPDVSLLLPDNHDLVSDYKLLLLKKDLTVQQEVCELMDKIRPDYIFFSAAKVGGILANNSFPAEFIYQNIMMESNTIHAAHLSGVQKLLFLGSSCIYPKLAGQPIKEEYLLNGVLEPTNEPYAIAKIAGIKLCESYNRQYRRDYRSIMPTNLYGPGDNYDLITSHVIPALIRKFHLGKCLEQGDWEAVRADFSSRPINCVDHKASDKVILNTLADHGIFFHASPKTTYPSPLTIKVWGTGAVRREFLHVNDLAEGCIYIMNLTENEFLQNTDPMNSHINIGAGQDLSIRELAEEIAEITAYKGKIEFDSNMPDGTPRKLLDVSKITHMGWKASISLSQGLRQTYSCFLNSIQKNS